MSTIRSQASRNLINGSVENRTPFKLNKTLTGEAIPCVGGYSHGRARGASYIIYSYAEPIAWFKDGQWYTTTRKWSRTTNMHLSNVRAAIRYATGDYGTETGE